MNSTIPVRPDDAAAAVLPGLRRVVVPTDAGDDRLAHARRVATRLAVDHGWELVLYDRSHETWIDTPHARGPVRRSELDGDDWTHLEVQMADIEDAGVHVSAWLATVPSISAMIYAFREMDVDGVLVPDELGRAKLMDRLLTGDDPAEVVGRVADLQLPDDAPRFLVVDAEGRVTTSAPPEET